MTDATKPGARPGPGGAAWGGDCLPGVIGHLSWDIRFQSFADIAAAVSIAVALTMVVCCVVEAVAA